ncbi:sensor domain-containing diguanylate cyclase [Billgrantia bachuensis]|uniref:diguanylate cyclase n=1 Tax=Billgrantia bachuensis TaxID=2717286 RepID=A0ABX0PTJ2_9GAMM|nr:diguanylate cyclase [Halomonas bachuensis]NIC05800.1 diguanylate cyclase [Halomonas bachuensis]
MTDPLDRELAAGLCPSALPIDDAVQPHGCLIAFDHDWQGVSLVSANLYRFFGLLPSEALGRPPEDVLGADIAMALATALTRGAPGMTIRPGRRDASGQGETDSPPLYVSAHMTGQHVILEAEPLAEESHELPGIGCAWGARLARASSVNELHAQLLRALYALTGFDSCTLEHGGHSLPQGNEGTRSEPFPSAADGCVNPSLMLVDGQAEPIELLAVPGPLPDLSPCPLCQPSPALHAWLCSRWARAALILELCETLPDRSLVICRNRQPRHLAPPLRQLLQQLVQLAALRGALLREKQETQHRYRLLHERNTKLQWLAYTDPLTQVANRHRIEQVLEAELALASRNGSPLALLLFDVDHFKPINDTHGHEVGDRVLHRVAQEVQSQLRGSDHLGRWGGEEFVAVIPGCDLAQAQELAWRLCQTLAQCRIDPVVCVTASFGVAVHRPGDTSRKLVQRADLAMYRAKRAGRACVRTQENDE